MKRTSPDFRNFRKMNDYTLEVSETEVRPYDEIRTIVAIKHYATITRTFNFMARQVTTVHRDLVFQSRGETAGGSAAISTQATIRNFRDLESQAEVSLMRDKLVSMGGHPPELEVRRGKRKKQDKKARSPKMHR